MLETKETSEVIALEVAAPEGKGGILSIVLREKSCEAVCCFITLASLPFEKATVLDCCSKWLWQL